MINIAFTNQIFRFLYEAVFHQTSFVIILVGHFSYANDCLALFDIAEVCLSYLSIEWNEFGLRNDIHVIKELAAKHGSYHDSI